MKWLNIAKALAAVLPAAKAAGTRTLIGVGLVAVGLFLAPGAAKLCASLSNSLPPLEEFLPAIQTLPALHELRGSDG